MADGETPPPGRWARVRQTRWWRWGRWPLAGGAALGAAGFLALLYLYATVELPAEPPQLESSVVLDADGEEIAVLQRDGLRQEVSLDEVAPVVVEALIAAEDRGFRGHNGVDPRGIARALTNNAGGGDTQGGSTITQQLVKNSYLTPERSYSRKVREAILAVKLDRRTDKDEILERYLNTVYFGRGTYGIEAAARVYFDKSAADLTTPEAALLVGLLRAPESADPTRDPDVAKERRDSVIDDLVEVGDITAAEGEEAKAADLGATPVRSPVTLTAGVGAHVVEWIRAEVAAMVGPEALYGGGLTIHTTIDLDDQRAAEDAIAAVLTDPDAPQAALVSIDPDGRIRAHVGGRDYDALQVDLARGADGGGSGRQPGSTFKPLVLAAALQDETATLSTTYPAPGSLTLDVDGQPWEVDNYGGTDFGVVDVTEATAQSVNTVYAQMVLEVGPARAAELASALGITGEVAPDASLVLGTGSTSVLDMASAYSTLARDGEAVAPFLIERIERKGDEVFTADHPQRVRALDEGVARGVTHALRAVIDSGTGTGAQIDRPAAGKTGTTQGNVDAWFAGYTPNHTAVVWMGHPEGPERPMDGVTGGAEPAQIWKAYMDAALVDVEPADFAPPPDHLLRPLEGDTPQLSVSPASGVAGQTITVDGTGFDQCVAGWFVRLEPTEAASESDGGGTADQRSAQLVVPEGVAAGPGRVVAFCDRGSGPEPVAEAAFTFEADQTTTTAPPTTDATAPTTEPPDEPAPPSSPPRPTTTTTEPSEEPPPTTEG